MCHRMVSRPRKWQGQSVDCADEAIPHRVVESKRFGGPFVERLADWANVRSGRLILVNTPAAFIEAAQQEPVLTISHSNSLYRFKAPTIRTAGPPVQSSTSYSAASSFSPGLCQPERT